MVQKRQPAVCVIMALLSTFLFGCVDGGELYKARVDRIEPSVPGLVVKGGSVTGGLYLRNDTGVDVYIYDEQGQVQIKLTSQALFRKDEHGEWSYVRKGNEMSIDSVTTYTGSRGGQPAGRYRGQVMREWVIVGRAGDTLFKIYGQTVYEPP